jgi:hypothetical protein
MNPESSHSVDARRSEINRRNRAKWRGFTPDGLEKLRAAAMINQPWRYTTGPRTAAGKARSAQNGRYRQKGEKSSRELRTELADVFAFIHEMDAARRSLMSSEPRDPGQSSRSPAIA